MRKVAERVPLSVFLGGFIVALILASSGLLILWRMSADALAIRSTGVTQQARITELHNQKVDRIDVAYTVRGKDYQAQIAVPSLGGRKVGQEIILYVDPKDPARVVTGEGYSDSGGEQGAAQFLLIGSGVLTLVLIGRGIKDFTVWRRS